MLEAFSPELVRSAQLTAGQRSSIHELCTQAYGEDLGALFAVYAYPTHVLGFLNGELVSHAMWVTRWLQQGQGPLLRTAYVEMVATDPRYQGRGFASAVMRHLGTCVQDFDLAALSPSSSAFYARLGWELWRGPLFIRSEGQRVATPAEEQIMVLRLTRSPVLDLDAPLSAEWRLGELW